VAVVSGAAKSTTVATPATVAREDPAARIQGEITGKTVFSPSRSHLRSYCYFSIAVIFIGVYTNIFVRVAQQLSGTTFYTLRALCCDQRCRYKGEPSKEIEGEELFPPSRSLVHRVIFIAAAIIFIGVPRITLQ
jgi:hypothetical protein